MNITEAKQQILDYLETTLGSNSRHASNYETRFVQAQLMLIILDLDLSSGEKNACALAMAESIKSFNLVSPSELKMCLKRISTKLVDDGVDSWPDTSSIQSGSIDAAAVLFDRNTTLQKFLKALEQRVPREGHAKIREKIYHALTKVQLIISNSGGGGHKAAAKACADHISAQSPETNIVIVDMLHLFCFGRIRIGIDKRVAL